MQGFPRSSFYRYEGKAEPYDRHIGHSKIIIITNDDKGTIDDDTFICVGSHNFSTNAWGKDELQG